MKVTITRETIPVGGYAHLSQDMVTQFEVEISREEWRRIFTAMCLPAFLNSAVKGVSPDTILAAAHTWGERLLMYFDKGKC